VALAAAGLVPAATAQTLSPSAATADSRGPAVTFLAPVDKLTDVLPSEAGEHRTEKMRKRWEAMTAAERKAILQTWHDYLDPTLKEAYDQYLLQHPSGQTAPSASASGNSEESGGMTVTATALPATGVAPLTVTFRGDGYDPDGPILQWFWGFGDGEGTGGQFAVHTFTTPGTYWATLMAYGQNNSAFAQAMIQVLPPGSGGGGSGGGGDPTNLPPQVALTATPDEGQQPLVVAAAATASDPDGWITSYTWDFGDGGVATSASANHTYLAEGTFTARVTVTDNKGGWATAAAIIEVGSNVDSDGDGLPDKTERKLANQFMPDYFLSIFEFPGTGMSKFEDRPDEQRVSQVFSTIPPVANVYYRVTPLGVTGGKSYVQIDYLTPWNDDDGLVLGTACLSDIDILDFFGIWSPQFGSGLRAHDIDNERTIFRLVAPAASGGGLNTKPGAYAVDYVFTAAHENTIFDSSRIYRINPPRGPEVHYALYSSLSKHATYGFWPHGYPLLPPEFVGAIYGGVAVACFFVSPDTCDLLWFIADEVVFDCITEKHVPGLGGVAPPSGNRLNVGEADNPLPGARYILVPAMQDQLSVYFRIP
jgi:PKD repeat protein